MPSIYPELKLFSNRCLRAIKLLHNEEERTMRNSLSSGRFYTHRLIAKLLETNWWNNEKSAETWWKRSKAGEVTKFVAKIVEYSIFLTNHLNATKSKKSLALEEVKNHERISQVNVCYVVKPQDYIVSSWFLGRRRQQASESERRKGTIYSGNVPCFIHESPKNIRRGQVLHGNIEKLLFRTASETIKYFFSPSHRRWRSMTILINDQLLSLAVSLFMYFLVSETAYDSRWLLCDLN